MTIQLNYYCELPLIIFFFSVLAQDPAIGPEFGETAPAGPVEYQPQEAQSQESPEADET